MGEPSHQALVGGAMIAITLARGWVDGPATTDLPALLETLRDGVSLEPAGAVDHALGMLEVLGRVPEREIMRDTLRRAYDELVEIVGRRAPGQDDPAWGDFVEFVRSRPEVIQRLMLEWPPLCVVKAREDVILLCPAPGIEGTVVSYYEDGGLGVAAPMSIPHPTHGWGELEPGDPLKAECKPEALRLVREERWTRTDVRFALGSDDG